jgi:site-specific DNA-methyltransferase (adenine-specific)
MKSTDVIFSSATVEWGTPPDLFKALNLEFCFTLDPCQPNSVLDGREIDWRGHRVFCNPPYGRRAKISTWLAKAREAEIAVFLLPVRTDTAWFHDYALKADEIRFFRGRLKFCKDHIAPRVDSNAAPFPSMLVIFYKGLFFPK